VEPWGGREGAKQKREVGKLKQICALHTESKKQALQKTDVRLTSKD